MMKSKTKHLLDPVYEFFKSQGWTPFPFQTKMWQAALDGQSGLLHVPTGSGKTYAATLGYFAKFLNNPRPGLKIIYITPLRALTRDMEQALQLPIQSQKWPIRVEVRTGDTPFAKKKKQLQSAADLMLITPESLAVLISQPEGENLLKHVEVVILDEWHELLASKRGSQTELNLSYLRSLNSDLQVWALSASIGNIEQAAQVAVGVLQKPLIISAAKGLQREMDLQCLLPEQIDRFPWAGHLGLSMQNQLLAVLNSEVSTLIFTNTRMLAEKWFQTLLTARPDLSDQMALHHSALSRDERERVETGVKDGSIKWVVCTSSLDLGIDFQPVEKVVQIGSPKMVARMLQRAGRSAHRPGGKSQLLFVPTNSWEIAEVEAVRKALAENHIEPRYPLHKPLDVLIQHMTTLACGPGLKLEELHLALKETFSFASITRAELNWCLQFLTQGGMSLQNYPQFKKLSYDAEDGRYHIASSAHARNHRLTIGTITSYESVSVRFTNRSRVGSVDESFIAKLRPGDIFQFAGKRLEFIKLKDMTAYVRISNRPTNTIPSWGGTKFPISETLSQSFREILQDPSPFLQKNISPLLLAQSKTSLIPDTNTLLIEEWLSKDGLHLFVYPFSGALVHEGLAQLWGLRFARKKESTFSFSVNDYGFEILAPQDYSFKDQFDQSFFSALDLPAEIGKSLELNQMSQRHFREIAQISGLVHTGFPGSAKTGRQMQVSSSLLFDVFKKYEPDNLLIQQSYNEVLHGALESERMRRTLERMQKLKIQWLNLTTPSPLAFPLLVERVASHLSNERLEVKVERLIRSMDSRQ